MVSTRRSQSGKPKYEVGARVEVVRADGVSIGILLFIKDDDEVVSTVSPSSVTSAAFASSAAEGSRSTRSSSASSSTRCLKVLASKSVTHWMVKVDGNNEPEDISEHSLGRVVAAAPPAEKQARSSTANVKIDSTSNSTGKSVSGTSAAQDGVFNRKAIAPKAPQPPHKAAVNKGKMVQQKQMKLKMNAAKKGGMGAKSNPGAAMPAGAQALGTVANQGKSARPGQEKSTDRGIYTTRHGQPVLKIPMLTGTLYIYQAGSDRPRQAEFVRTK